MQQGTRKKRWTSWALLILLCSLGIGTHPQGQTYAKTVARLWSLHTDSLAPRLPVQKTVPVTLDDVDPQRADLKTPDNIKASTTYNETTGDYEVGTKLGESYLNTPFFMSPQQYQQWTLQKSLRTYFRDKNQEEYKKKGKEDFSFTDMKFDLGPAEKIFGPGGVRIKTQGGIELKLGANMQSTENPSLPINRRSTFGFDFDEKINVNLTGSVGDKMNMNLNYNTEATFDFDTKNIKLRYEGKEDEIIKLVEAGNVSLPTNSSLVRGASSLFGVRTDMQFGKLKLQAVVSQKKTSTQSVSSQGGTQLNTFEIPVNNYEANRHFFLAHFFRNRYNASMAQLPNVTSGITIGRIEVWVTNNTGATTNTRNLVALTDLGDPENISNPIWDKGTDAYPSNMANDLYPTLVNGYASVRNINQTTQVLGTIQGFVGGVDFEKLENARRLNSSEFTINNALGYISLRTTLQPDQVLAVAYEYTFQGHTYQVGEFSSDNTNNNAALLVKTLKNTTNTPTMGNWDLMMKNVYALGAMSVQKERFKLNIQYLSDSTGVYLNYLNEPSLHGMPLIRLIGMDRLDDQNNHNANGTFDFVPGYTIDPQSGRIFFTTTEPFGSTLATAIKDPSLVHKYAFTSLYDSLKTIAQQDAEHDKFMIVGEYKGTAGNEIQLGATNIPRGSVVVTANGVRLTENADYAVDYNAGIVTIINQSLLDAGTAVNVSLESESNMSMQRKTLLGLNWSYDFSKNFILGGTFMHLSEQALTSKVAMGNEPLNNTLWGLNLSWKQQSQWITDMLNKLPFVNASSPSSINLTAEFAHLIAGKSKGAQDNASYIDDFENTSSKINIATPTEWMLSSTPTLFTESQYNNDIRYGYNRALLSWYYIDPLLTRRNSSLTPSHIKSDLTQLSNHYVREVYSRELFPNTQTNYGEPATLSVLNLAYYPNERGPYNLDTNLSADGHLLSPRHRWGGMMRKVETTDFETANIEYIEFWMLDPFIYSKETGQDLSGDLYFNLGDISEDVLRDGQKYAESDMPLQQDTTQLRATAWGWVPRQKTTTYAFNNGTNTRALQDVGLNGMNSATEATRPPYNNYLKQVQGKLSPAAYESFLRDPAADDYHYFRGSDYDALGKSILERYKYINLPEGNSEDAEHARERYSTSYKTLPDVEDINSDYTLNEYERYYQYKIRISPDSMTVGKNYIVDARTASVTLRNNKTEKATWYLFRIPVDQYQHKVGGINDFSNIRFMRMFLTGFERPVVLRFATLDLVRGEWRNYTKPLSLTAPANNGTLVASSVSYEENSGKTPVNYVLPPGITRVIDPSQRQLQEENEAALSLVATALNSNEARAVYKKTRLDLRNYKRLKMFTHANALPEGSALEDNQVSVFLRLGSDYTNNYYEYEVPLSVTAADKYSTNSLSDSKKVWPEANNIDINIDIFTAVKKERNRQRSAGLISGLQPFAVYDTERPNNKVSIVGNPTLGEVRTLMVGIKNNTSTPKDAEVWVNELRLQDYNDQGGWAAQGNLNVQLSDIGTLNLQGAYESAGFGGIEDRIAARRKDDLTKYGLTASIELGRFLPALLKVQAPLYYAYSREEHAPLYNPLDTDMKLSEAIDALLSDHEKDSLRHLTVMRTTHSNFSISNARLNIATKGNPMPYDPANFTFGYAYSRQENAGETTAWERQQSWKWSFTYNYAPFYKTWEPFKHINQRNKWLRIIRDFGLNYLPQSIALNSDLARTYYELQERDINNLQNTTSIPIVWSSSFLWRRNFSLRWDLTKNLQMTFTSATNAEIEMPYTPVNKDLYPDEYTAWKDSVWHSIRQMGTPLNYQQTFNASYNLPLNKFPLFSWINANTSYAATYSWDRGYMYQDGSTLGNTIANSRNVNGRADFNLETLYNMVPFLQKANRRFATVQSTSVQKREKEKRQMFQKEITLLQDTTLTILHNQKNKRISVRAIRQDGTPYPIRYKVLDANKIIVLSRDTTKLKLTVIPARPTEKQSWYRALQTTARALMMVRNVAVTYTNTYNMALPGFLPTVGNILGQRSGGTLQPGLGFAFGLTGDTFIDRAMERGWLLSTDSISTPATTNETENLQLTARIEPLRDFRISLHANRMVNRAKSIQYMFPDAPTTQTGSFTMTTISIASSFESSGGASNGYRSASFLKFTQLLAPFRQRFETQYAGAHYPQGTPQAGQPYDPVHGTPSPYSADVMIPAFLAAYTGGSVHSPMEIFPAITRLLPNWSVTYAGLSRLPALQSIFKSFNINHSYKSTYNVGGYNTLASYRSSPEGLGFVTEAATGKAIPSSMYDINTVSLSESFSPLIGVDMTFHNNLTARLEYRRMRMLSLSMTSYQINETGSNDLVIGLGYKVNNFKLFASKTRKRNTTRRPASRRNNDQQSNIGGTSTFNNALTLQLDLSVRSQQALNRDIATLISTATSGNNALKISFSANYVLSRLMTLSAYYDRQQNNPLLTSSAYPTTTQDFGVSFKFSLTR